MEQHQAEFKRALAKYERQKAKRAAALAAADPAAPKINTALPLQPAVVPVAKKEKPQEQPRPRPKALEISVSGPVELKFVIEWSGTLLGGQMNPHSMKDLFLKHLRPLGSVKQV